jgi:uncharacterized protein
VVAVGERRGGGGERRYGGETIECERAVGSSAIELGCVGIGAPKARYVHAASKDSRLHHGESAKLTSPDLLIIGTGPSVYPIAPNVRKYLNDLGIRLEIQDTRNAAAQFNLLATERGVGQVAAALVPIGWRESK